MPPLRRRRRHSPSVSVSISIYTRKSSRRRRRPSSTSNPMAAPADVVPPAPDIAGQQNVNLPRPQNITSSPPPTMEGAAEGICAQQNLGFQEQQNHQQVRSANPRPQNITSSPPPTMAGGAEGICAQQNLSFQKQRQNHKQKTSLELEDTSADIMKLLKHEIESKFLQINENLAHSKKGGLVDDQVADAEAEFAQLQTEFKKLNPHFQIYTQSAPKAPSSEGGPFDLLTDADERRVRHALDGGNRSEKLSEHKSSNIVIERETLQCLNDGGLLNVINLYLQLLKERELREPNKFLKCHFFNTFFYMKLIGGNGEYDYEAVRKWTEKKKLGYNIIDCDKIFVPIQKEVHWCLAVINTRDKKFQYVDSIDSEDMKALEILAMYLVDEVKYKNNKQIDVLSWEHEVVKERPSQDTKTDCGMFMLKYIDFYSRDMDLIFEQKHMPYFRRRTAKEILDLRAG
uniref:Uncharacterized protein n=1 Tax=Avena sativa TaxID=4498 RepID=A0ACD5TBE9_AVESA